ncbi:hypothetical protein [Plantactinospora endophytica]|uniref:Uncharacterized protein n=1 Tax=Plantactinospora endophytica TaxID=673535 RepID=A0ABQ4E3F2_9ACTN|nr:hypothetical protein [Plantactinospora endophytica]GIG89205.1 hypothetical protein Pen02_41410 [Plantactinospora endophytica]
MNSCTLHPGEPACDRFGLIEIEDGTGARAWTCVEHAIRAIWTIDGVHVVRDLRTERAGAGR